MIRRPPRSTLSSSSAASDVYKRQEIQISELSAIAPAMFGTAHPYEEIVFTREPPGLKYFTEEPEEIVNPVEELSNDLLNIPLVNKKSELLSLTEKTWSPPERGSDRFA